MKQWYYISLEEALVLHKKELARFGGAPGVRDPGLLISALVQAKLFLFGECVYKDVHEIAAVYAFHIIKNHSFVDGNKRTGILVVLIFLAINNYSLRVTKKELYELVMDIAASKLTKEQVVAFFEKKVRSLREN